MQNTIYIKLLYKAHFPLSFCVLPELKYALQGMGYKLQCIFTSGEASFPQYWDYYLVWITVAPIIQVHHAAILGEARVFVTTYTSVLVLKM